MQMEMEIDPLVIDCGSHSTNVAVAVLSGTEYTKTKVSIPTVVGMSRNRGFCCFGMYKDSYVGQEAIKKRGILQLKYPIEGAITDYDNYEKLLHHTFYNDLRVDPEEHCIMLTDYCNELNNTTATTQRKKITEILFETFNAPGLCVADKSIMSTYSTGRTSGIVVDCGHYNTRINAVYEGSCIPNSSQSIDFAGYAINDHFTTLMNTSGFSFTTSAERDILVDIKEQHSFVSLNYNQQTKSTNNSIDYELPDGQVITINDQLFKASEPLFNPSSFTKYSANKSIQEAIVDCYNSCPDEVKEEMISNIIVVGGTSNTTNFNQRLQIELNNELKKQNICNEKKVNLITQQNAQLSALNGGLIYCSLHEFTDSLMTKDQYDEYGPNDSLIRFY